MYRVRCGCLAGACPVNRPAALARRSTPGRCLSAARPLCSCRRPSRGLLCGALAKDSAGRPPPRSLAELLPFESDSDSNDDDVEEPRVVASDTDEGAGGLAATLGLAGARPGAAPPTDGDGSADAEEIINRATQVLQAARQALKTEGKAAGARRPPADVAGAPTAPSVPPPAQGPPRSSSSGGGGAPAARSDKALSSARPANPISIRSSGRLVAPPPPPTAPPGTNPNSSSSSSSRPASPRPRPPKPQSPPPGARPAAGPGLRPPPPPAPGPPSSSGGQVRAPPPPRPGAAGAAAGGRAGTAPPPPTGSTSSSRSAGSPPPQPPSPLPPMASSSSSSGRLGGGGQEAPGAAAGDGLTRRWSPLSDDQDVMRHVLQSALDDMQAKGADIDTPPDLQQQQSRPSSSAPPAAPARSSGPPPPGAAAETAKKFTEQLKKSPGSGRQPPGGWPSSSSGGGGGGGGGGGTSGAAPPSWAASFLSADSFGSGGGGGPPEPQLQRAPAAARAAAGPLEVLERPAAPAALELALQSDADAARARTAVLPPLLSVVELTTAFRPPERNVEVQMSEGEAEGAVVTAGRQLADGSGVLADGTRWEKKSGIEYGKNGYWKRWHVLSGSSLEGAVTWSETWWEASDYTGLKELGAEKEGQAADGSKWKESWTERLYYASNDLDSVVERQAHKWAVDENKDEWEEKWGEYYHASGKVAKWADKWGKHGPNVWHERWGEDYAGGETDACVKWTDKWAERLLPGGAREQWGDKWHEQFSHGRGEKNGEVWSVDAGGHRYQRWWGEQHMGEGRVRRHGHSTAGEYWDDTIHMDTYYNPVPHFGYSLAMAHSPQLKGVPLRPKEVDEANPFGIGLDDL